MFYHEMCQDKPHLSRPCMRTSPCSEPSASRIRVQKHAAKPPQSNKFTYPVLSKKLKCPTSTSESTKNSESDATEIYSVPSEPDYQDSDTPPSTSKGSFVTKTYGVRNPVKYSRKATIHPKKCPKCEYQSDSFAGINAHYKNSHEPVTCEQCSLSFSTPSTLRQHMYTHKELKFTCNKCNKGFLFASDLRVHQVKHDSVHTHKCNKCPKSFFMKGDLL